MQSAFKKIPKPGPRSNKYTRGHLAVLGGPLQCTGAARLAALAGARTGAGLVTILCDKKSLIVYARSLLSVMTQELTNAKSLTDFMNKRKVRAIILGPGAGISNRTRDMVAAALKSGLPAVLDADALSVFKDAPEKLFNMIQSPCLLTPHDGEFARLFPDISLQPRNAAAQKAAQRSGAVILLKGPETIIAGPDGRIKKMPRASAYLATAGSGDVLAGICGGLMAQGLTPYDAAILGAKIHAVCAKNISAGLIAEDLVAEIPKTLKKLR